MNIKLTNDGSLMRHVLILSRDTAPSDPPVGSEEGVQDKREVVLAPGESVTLADYERVMRVWDVDPARRKS